MGKAFSFAKAIKGLGTAALAALAFHAGTWTAQYSYNLQQQESSLRRSFKKEFGIPLYGYQEDIEQAPGRITEIAASLHQEGTDNISSLYIVSPTYLRKPYNRQFMDVSEKVSDGIQKVVSLKDIFASKQPSVQGPQPHRFFDPPEKPGFGEYLGQIGGIELDHHMALGGKYPAGLALHEIKHAETSAIMKKHPEFEQEWKRAAGKKNAFYQPLHVQLFQYAGIIKDSDDPAEISSAQEHGFTNPYGETNWYEDAAQIGSWGEEAIMHFYDVQNDYGGLFISWLYDDKNPAVIRQVNVAQKYGLLPQEFSQAILLEKEYRAVRDTHQYAQEFIKDSAVFLKNYPQSKYAIEIRYARGRVFWELAKRSQQPWPYQQAAMREWKHGINAKHKELRTYEYSLEALRDYYYTNGEKQNVQRYDDAIREYRSRYNANDVRLSVIGVNDYLRP